VEAVNQPEGGSDRHETPSERLDRNWEELLQELRVAQTGVQLIAGFLLTLPFQSAFEDLDGFATGLYLTLVVLAALTVGLTLTPISLHRRLFRRHVKDQLVNTVHVLTRVVLGAIALLITGISVLIFDVVVSQTAGFVTGVLLLAVLVLLLVALPAAVARRPR
jgi:Family of unknown function (DUF6328)